MGSGAGAPCGDETKNGEMATWFVSSGAGGAQLKDAFMLRQLHRFHRRVACPRAGQLPRVRQQVGRSCHRPGDSRDRCSNFGIVRGWGAGIPQQDPSPVISVT